MELEIKPNILSDLLQDVPPISDHLERIYRGIDALTMEAEQIRLQQRFLDLASKLVAINQIRTAE